MLLNVYMMFGKYKHNVYLCVIKLERKNEISKL